MIIKKIIIIIINCGFNTSNLIKIIIMIIIIMIIIKRIIFKPD